MLASEVGELNAWSALLQRANVTAGVDVISGLRRRDHWIVLAKAIALRWRPE